MSAVPIAAVLLTPDEYLAFEEEAAERHEYLHGAVYAMAGGSQNHDLICGDLFTALNTRLGAGPCVAFTANMKLRIEEPGNGRFYYPDAMVVCGPPSGKSYQTEPTAVFEVLSDSTERQDRGEKRDACCGLPSLQCYVLIAQDRTRAEVWRRVGAQWEAHVFDELSDVLPLVAIGCEISLTEIYRRISP